MDKDKNIHHTKQKIREIMGFYIHSTVFFIILALLFVIDLMTGPSWWVQWPFLGWGIGILAHATCVYWKTPLFVRAWQRRKIRELMLKG